MIKQKSYKYACRLLYNKAQAIVMLALLISGMFFIAGCDDGEGTYTTPVLNVVSADYLFNQFGGNGTITVENTGQSVTATCEQAWISSLSANGTTITFTVSANSTINSRIAKIALTSDGLSSDVTVMQYSAMFTNEGEYNLSSEGGSAVLSLPTELEYSVSVDNAPWITSYEITGDGIAITFEAVPTTEPRSATVTLASPTGRGSETFTVTQSGYDFGLYPTTLNFSIEGGPLDVIVSGNRDYSVTTGANWLTYTKTTDGGIFTAASNAGGNERAADVVFTDVTYGAVTTFKVTQNPDPTEYEEYLGDWTMTDYNGNAYTVTFSENVKNVSFIMTSASFEYPMIWNWSADNYGRRLTFYCQQLATTSEGNLILAMPAYITSTGGVSFNTGIGSGASYFKYDGNSTISCDGGTSSTYNGFVIYIRNAANSGNIGWYTGGPNIFIGTTLTR